MTDAGTALPVDGEVTGWWLYRLPDGRTVRVDVGAEPLRWDVDVQDGDQYAGLTTPQVENLLRDAAVAR